MCMGYCIHPGIPQKIMRKSQRIKDPVDGRDRSGSLGRCVENCPGEPPDQQHMLWTPHDQGLTVCQALRRLFKGAQTTVHTALPSLKSLLACSANSPGVNRALRGKDSSSSTYRTQQPEEEKHAEVSKWQLPVNKDCKRRKKTALIFLWD